MNPSFTKAIGLLTFSLGNFIGPSKKPASALLITSRARALPFPCPPSTSISGSPSDSTRNPPVLIPALQRKSQRSLPAYGLAHLATAALWYVPLSQHLEFATGISYASPSVYVLRLTKLSYLYRLVDMISAKPAGSDP